jgi:muramoyltetrapeptide carboxypeptidase
VKLTIPPRLQKGDVIGIISPSAGLAPFAMHRIDRAVAYLTKMGFKVRMGTHALKNAGYVSASIESRVEDIHDMFLDSSVKAVLCTLGGNNANQLLPYLDYALIKKHPKIFMGYSDISVLHFAIMSQAHLATYYGPCIMTQFGEYPKPLPYTIESFENAVMKNSFKKSVVIKSSTNWTDEVLNWFEKKDLTRARKLLKHEGYVWLKKGKASGPLWGGTIPSINHLLGTKYWYAPDKSIIFIDIPEGKDIVSSVEVAEVDALLTNLYNARVFDKAVGLVIGRPYRCAKPDQENLKEVILRITKQYDFPIVYNVNIGHVDPIITLRYGQVMDLNAKANSIILNNE